MLEPLNTIALLASVAIGWIVLFSFIPWSMRVLVLCKLHDARDRAYAVAQRNGDVARMLLYRDIETIITNTIHVVRDCKYMDSVALAAVLGEARRRTKEDRMGEGSWRTERYRLERRHLLKTKSGNDDFNDLLAALWAADKFLAIRVASGHPLAMATTVALSVFVVVKVVAEMKLSRFYPEKTLSNIFDVAAMPSHSSGKFGTLLAAGNAFAGRA